VKVVADRGRCVGAGQCVLTVPELFDQDLADGTVVLLDEHPAGELADAALDAVRVCPSQALSIEPF
jgi:ferredoxin